MLVGADQGACTFVLCDNFVSRVKTERDEITVTFDCMVTGSYYEDNLVMR